MYEQASRVPPQQEPEHEDMKPLSLTQRLNRLRFCCYQLTGSLIVVLSAILLMIFARATFMPEAGAMVLYSLLSGLVLASLIWFIGLMVRRLHDLDQSGWWALLTLVPVVNVLLLLYLLLAPGTAGANRFGATNPDNGVLVVLVGGLWWALQILGTVSNVIVIGLALLGPGSLSEWKSQVRERFEHSMQQQMMERADPGSGSR